MINVDKLETMAESLRLYDVVDGGWEGDPEGTNNPKSVEDNLKHVGEHLAGVLAFKDFTDSSIVKYEIAPDFVQYGLRVARWGGIEAEKLDAQDSSYIPQAREINDRLGIGYVGTLPVASLILANGILMGQQMHDEDHEAIRSNAIEERPKKLKLAGQILLNTAYYQAVNNEFDLTMAFEDRIARLRSRRNVPRLDKI